MSTPHLHTQRLLQDLEHLSRMARSDAQHNHGSGNTTEAEYDAVLRELSNINRRLRKELRRVSVVTATTPPQVKVERSTSDPYGHGDSLVIRG